MKTVLLLLVYEKEIMMNIMPQWKKNVFTKCLQIRCYRTREKHFWEDRSWEKDKKWSSDGIVSSSHGTHSMDSAYSNTYNLLQPNYGHCRHSYPIDDIDTKKVSRKYYSLEKFDVPNESQDELHIQNNTPKCIVLGNWKLLNI